MQSDVIIFGTPVYWYGPTALMKCFIDRFVYFNCPENRKKIRGKSAVIAVPFEEENPKTADLLVKFFEKSFHYLEMNLINKILVPGVSRRGDILRKRELLEKGYRLGRKIAKYNR
jgi:multimeric flavodoxin WrbA